MEYNFLDYIGLSSVINKIKSITATKSQGEKADSAVQSIKISDIDIKYEGPNVVLPSYLSYTIEESEDGSGISLKCSDGTKTTVGISKNELYMQENEPTSMNSGALWLSE